jgi:hypothetical protein
MHINLRSEIKYLHSKIEEKKKAFNKGLKNDIEFGALKKIFCEIKELDKCRRIALSNLSNTYCKIY